MSARTILLTILFGGIAFAAVGGLFGAALGTFVPGYYRTVFAAGRLPDFHPIQLGIGLGVTQGFALGLALSVCAVAVQAGRDIYLGAHAPATPGHARPRGSRSWTIHAVWALTVLILAAIVGTVTFVAGGIVGQQQLYQVWTDRKLEALAPILADHDYRTVSAETSSAANVYLTGTVENDTAYRSLHQKLTLAFGVATTDEMIGNVKVAR